MALKAMIGAFDLGSIALLLAMLSSRSQPLRFAGFYAFNPIPLIGFGAEAHFDSLLIFFIVLALWLRERRCAAWSWAALGLAVQIKLVAVLLIPLFSRQGGWRKAWVGALVAAVPFLPYCADVGTWLVGVLHFGVASRLQWIGSFPSLASIR